MCIQTKLVHQHYSYTTMPLYSVNSWKSIFLLSSAKICLRYISQQFLQWVLILVYYKLVNWGDWSLEWLRETDYSTIKMIQLVASLLWGIISWKPLEASIQITPEYLVLHDHYHSLRALRNFVGELLIVAVWTSLSTQPKYCKTGPQPLGLGLVPVLGLLGIRPHSWKWTVGKQAKPKPFPPICGNFVFQKTGPWWQKDWGLLQ